MSIEKEFNPNDKESVAIRSLMHAAELLVTLWTKNKVIEGML